MNTGRKYIANNKYFDSTFFNILIKHYYCDDYFKNIIYDSIKEKNTISYSIAYSPLP